MVIVRWIPVILYGIFIFFFAQSPESSAGNMSSQLLKWFPNLEQETLKLIIFYLRKLIHIAGYYFATVLIFFAAKTTPKLRDRPYLIALVFSLILASLDEWYQTTLPHRTGSVTDVIIDLVGIILALVSLKLITKNSHH